MQTNMQWIKYRNDIKGHKAGEIVQVEQAAAAALIAAEVAEEAPAPAEVADAATQLKGTLAEFVQTTVSEGFAELRRELAPVTRRIVHLEEQDRDAQRFRLPAGVKKFGALQHFKGAAADERAYRFGMFMLGVHGRKSARDWCEAHGIRFVDELAEKTQRESNNASSGFLVPDEFQNDLIDLREQYGVFRQNARIVPMTSDARSDPRRIGGLTAYFVGESTAATTSDKTWDRVRLTAKKLMVLSKYSNELSEDAVLNIGDDLAGEIAYSFALKEDQCGFVGDGTSTYGGIVGVTSALRNLDATVANIKGLVVASGTGYGSGYGSTVLGDFNKVVGTLPQYAFRAGDVKWYVSQYFWGSVMQKLAAAAGGNRIADISAGALQPTFLGFPVEIAQVLPATAATNQICALFGNLRLAARLGDRRQTTIQMSEHALNAFEQDEVVLRGTERFDIVVHDVGDSTASPRNASIGAVSGPVVGLITASS